MYPISTTNLHRVVGIRLHVQKFPGGPNTGPAFTSTSFIFELEDGGHVEVIAFSEKPLVVESTPAEEDE